jgi:hypothetical protein
MSLSAGTLWLGIKQARAGAAPSDRYAVVTGAAVGLLGGICMAAISVLCAGVKRGDFGLPVLPVWLPLVMGVPYGVVLLWCYHRRLTARHPFWAMLGKACGLCFLLKAISTFIYLGLTRPGYQMLADLATESMLMSLLEAVPFALFWVLATALLDPAWRPEQEEESSCHRAKAS